MYLSHLSIFMFIYVIFAFFSSSHLFILLSMLRKINASVMCFFVFVSL